MELAGILIVPLLASGFALLPAGRRLAAPVTLVASAIVLGLAVAVAAEAARTGQVAASGEWLTCDGLGALVLLLVAFVGFTAALFSWGYIAESVKHGPRKSIQLYYALYNLFVLSMLSVPLLANVALMWIAVELTTLLSAFLVGFEDTPKALEAAWKYVILTTLGAVLALLGFLILYWGSRVAGLEPFTWVGLAEAAPRMPPALLWPAFLFILVGFGTKVGLVPMHTWLPDAHSQAPAPICALLSGVETTTVLYVILRLFPVVGVAPGLDARPWFIGFGLLSVAIATLLFIHVRDFKRMFAFSTVEHMGIILVAAGLGGADAHLGAALPDDGPRNRQILLLLCGGRDRAWRRHARDCGRAWSRPLVAACRHRASHGRLCHRRCAALRRVRERVRDSQGGPRQRPISCGRAFGSPRRYRILRRHASGEPDGVRRSGT
jgi:hydrogenase-4 component F